MYADDVHLRYRNVSVLSITNEFQLLKIHDWTGKQTFIQCDANKTKQINKTSCLVKLETDDGDGRK